MPVLDGIIKLKLDPGINDGDVKKLSNMGIKVKKSRFKGDHYLTFKIDIPTKLSEKEKQIL